MTFTRCSCLDLVALPATPETLRVRGPADRDQYTSALLFPLSPRFAYSVPECPFYTTCLYTLRVSWAVFSHEYDLARSRPLATRAFRKESSFRTLRMAEDNAVVSSGSTIKPASPITSGSDEVLLVTTGVPQAIASKGGRPNPS